MNGLDRLAEIAREIEQLKAALDDAYERRAETILDALDDFRSLRDCAEALGISHTAVAKAIRGVDREALRRAPRAYPDVCASSTPRSSSPSGATSTGTTANSGPKPNESEVDPGAM